LLNVGTLLAFRADALVIGAFLPAEEATYFDMGNKFFDPLTQFLIAVGAVIMPMTTRLATLGQGEELRHLFLKWSKICLSLALLVGLGKPAFPALALLGMGAINLVLSLALVRSHGILGVAFGTALPNVLFAGAVLLRACRELDVPLAR